MNLFYINISFNKYTYQIIRGKMLNSYYFSYTVSFSIINKIILYYIGRMQYLFIWEYKKRIFYGIFHI